MLSSQPSASSEVVAQFAYGLIRQVYYFAKVTQIPKAALKRGIVWLFNRYKWLLFTLVE